jgi:hypothetical protein
VRRGGHGSRITDHASRITIDTFLERFPMRKAKILVVDDEHLIRWSLEQSLLKQG